MSSAKFTGSRGIVPQAIARVRVPGHILAFNIPGLPYSEPTFTSIVRSNPADIEKPELLGVAYLITQDQYIRVLASEGGGIAYDDIEVKCIPVSETDRQIIGSHVMVKTLGPAMERSPWPKPSRRYMNIILAGSREMQLPREYHRFLESQPVYEPPLSWWGKVGAAIFLAIWGPVMGAMEKSPI